MLLTLSKQLNYSTQNFIFGDQVVCTVYISFDKITAIYHFLLGHNFALCAVFIVPK